MKEYSIQILFQLKTVYLDLLEFRRDSQSSGSSQVLKEMQ